MKPSKKKAYAAVGIPVLIAVVITTGYFTLWAPAQDGWKTELTIDGEMIPIGTQNLSFKADAFPAPDRIRLSWEMETEYPVIIRLWWLSDDGNMQTMERIENEWGPEVVVIVPAFRGNDLYVRIELPTPQGQDNVFHDFTLTVEVPA